MTVIQYHRGNTFYIVMCNSVQIIILLIKYSFIKSFFCSFIKCSYFHNIPDMVFSWTIKEKYYFKTYFRFDICIAQDTDHMEGNIGAAALLWSCNLTHDQMCILWLADFSILFFSRDKVEFEKVQIYSIKSDMSSYQKIILNTHIQCNMYRLW